MVEKIREKIRNFVSMNLTSLGSEDLRNDDDLFQMGYVDSLFAMRLLTFIEKEFSIDVCVDDINVENFKSIDNIYKLVSRYSER